jgi:hypothetical protein
MELKAVPSPYSHGEVGFPTACTTATAPRAGPLRYCTCYPWTDETFDVAYRIENLMAAIVKVVFVWGVVDDVASPDTFSAYRHDALALRCLHNGQCRTLGLAHVWTPRAHPDGGDVRVSSCGKILIHCGSVLLHWRLQPWIIHDSHRIDEQSIFSRWVSLHDCRLFLLSGRDRVLLVPKRQCRSPRLRDTGIE